jgi:hypothetical protein
MPHEFAALLDHHQSTNRSPTTNDTIRAAQSSALKTVALAKILERGQQRGLDLSELADLLAVRRRSVRRYLAVLRMAGARIESKLGSDRRRRFYRLSWPTSAKRS